VVFDCDGVLTDTTGCWDEAFTHVAQLWGLRLQASQLHALHGAAVTDAGRRLAHWATKRDEADEIVKTLDAQVLASIDAANLEPLTGVRPLLDELGEEIPLAVASNAPRRVLLHVLARLDLTGYFSCVISADDVDHPKPAADPYVAACRALRAQPEKSFAVEDSLIGAASAAAAGLSVVEVGRNKKNGAAPHVSTPALQVASLADSRVAAFLLGRS
jgi:HAD superfamily hydrolase (TIGR01509 family)